MMLPMSRLPDAAPLDDAYMPIYSVTIYRLSKGGDLRFEVFSSVFYSLDEPYRFREAYLRRCAANGYQVYIQDAQNAAFWDAHHELFFDLIIDLPTAGLN